MKISKNLGTDMGDMERAKAAENAELRKLLLREFHPNNRQRERERALMYRSGRLGKKVLMNLELRTIQ